ncbi:hypothetical protein ABZ543_13015 [Streptomyces roseifaciens]
MTQPDPNQPTTPASSPTGPGASATPRADGTVTVQVPPASKQPAGQTFSAEDIERARQEEKDKLYGRLTKAEERFTTLESELATLRQEREAREKAEAAKAAAEEEAAQVKREADMSAKKLLEERSTEWERRFAEIQEERSREREALAKEAEFNKLRAYIQERISAERTAIAPELIDLISGNSPEEVDASVELMKAKTAAIAQSMSQAQQQQRSQMRGAAVTGYTPNGPTDDSGYRQLSAEDIKAMPMSEFAKYRSQLLGAASQSSVNRGLFD